MFNSQEKEFYLTIVRHGQTTANVLKNIQGHLNTPLTDLGIKQASKLGEYFHNCGPKKFHRVYTSDLGRALKTCEIILSHLTEHGPGSESSANTETVVIRDIRLRERKYGEAYEGKPIEMLKAEAFALGFNEENFTKYTPVGAESMAQVEKRAGDFCRDILFRQCQHHEEVLIISHWATIKEILKLFQPKANDSIRREHLLETPNTAFSRFKIRCKSQTTTSNCELQQNDHDHHHQRQQQQQQIEFINKYNLSTGDTRHWEKNDSDNLVSVETISLHQIPHLSSNQTSVNLRQPVE